MAITHGYHISPLPARSGRGCGGITVYLILGLKISFQCGADSGALVYAYLSVSVPGAHHRGRTVGSP